MLSSRDHPFWLVGSIHNTSNAFSLHAFLQIGHNVTLSSAQGTCPPDVTNLENDDLFNNIKKEMKNPIVCLPFIAIVVSMQVAKEVEVSAGKVTALDQSGPHRRKVAPNVARTLQPFDPRTLNPFLTMLLTFGIHFVQGFFWEKSIVQESSIQLGSWLIWPYIVGDYAYPWLSTLWRHFLMRQCWYL